MSSLSEMGVSVVDSAETDENNEDEEQAEGGKVAGNLSDSDVSGTRMMKVVIVTPIHRPVIVMMKKIQKI